MKFKSVGDGDRERFFVDGRQVERDEYDRLMAEERAALPQIEEDPELEGSRPWSRPLVSTALAYHPRQVQAAREHFEKNGLSGQLIQENGKVALPDRAIRRQVNRLNKMHDNDGGYSD